MNNMKFIRGMGIGVAVGTAIGLACAPRPVIRRNAADKAVKAVKELVEQMSDAIGL
jgi:gas vesicle protein